MITEFFNKPFENYKQSRLQLEEVQEMSPVNHRKMSNSYHLDSVKNRNQKLKSLPSRISELKDALLPHDYQKKLLKQKQVQFLNIKDRKDLFFGATSILHLGNSQSNSVCRVAQGLCEIFYDNDSYLIGFFQKGKLQNQFIYIISNGNYIKAKQRVQIPKQSLSGFRTDDTESLDSDDEKSQRYKIDEKDVKLSFYEQKQTSQFSNLQCEIQYNGILYKGTIQDGLLNGRVKQIGSDYQFQGYFYKGQRKKGKLISKNGFTYQGTFNNNQFDGLGVLITKDGVYNGQFRNGHKDGVGQFKWQDGSTYKGDFKNDQRHGKGFYKTKQGSFKGEWQNDQIDGAGYLVVGNKGIGGQFRKNIYQQPNKFF